MYEFVLQLNDEYETNFGRSPERDSVVFLWSRGYFFFL